MSVARNEITGDLVKTKSNSDDYRSGWDRIFGKKKEEEEKPIFHLRSYGDVTEEELRELTKQKLPTAVEYLPRNLDPVVLAGLPETLTTQNWHAWCEKHQLKISDIPTFEQWQSAHSQG